MPARASGSPATMRIRIGFIYQNLSGSRNSAGLLYTDPSISTNCHFFLASLFCQCHISFSATESHRIPQKFFFFCVFLCGSVANRTLPNYSLDILPPQRDNIATKQRNQPGYLPYNSSLCSLELNPTLAQSLHDGLRAIARRHFLQDRSHVIRDGLFFDLEQVRDLFVALAIRRLFQDLHLTRR